MLNDVLGKSSQISTSAHPAGPAGPAGPASELLLEPMLLADAKQCGVPEVLAIKQEKNGENDENPWKNTGSMRIYGNHP